MERKTRVNERSRSDIEMRTNTDAFLSRNLANYTRGPLYLQLSFGALTNHY